MLTKLIIKSLEAKVKLQYELKLVWLAEPRPENEQGKPFSHKNVVIMQTIFRFQSIIESF